MRIGIDITPVTATRTGVGNYCRHLLAHLLEIAPHDEFRGFSSGRARVTLGPMADRVAHRHFPIPTRVLYRLWSTLGRPSVDAYLGGIDVFHATNFVLPPTRSARRIVTIHDLTFLVRPDLCSPTIVGPFSKGVRRFCADADGILAYSESTRNDIVRLLDVDPAKIVVAPLAADPDLRPIEPSQARLHLNAVLGLDGPYFLFVSTLEPRKNLPTLVRAFAAIARDLPHRLVLAGPTGWNTGPIFAAIAQSGVADRIARPGYVSTQTLAALYSAAEALVFPSLYEGFGLPMLEAMTCGCPVIASDNSSMREVTGGAALHCEAEDADAFAQAMRRIAQDPACRTELGDRGRACSNQFSWKTCAEATLGLYRRLA